MNSRRDFLTALTAVPLGSTILRSATGASPAAIPPAEAWSEFSRRLRPVGRILEMEGWYVWCIAPIEGPNGRAHVFFSRWSAAKGMGGWIEVKDERRGRVRIRRGFRERAQNSQGSIGGAEHAGPGNHCSLLRGKGGEPRERES